jgi:4-amino-4-deoxy-L-arabinose transferase-like glycosyltransferase
MSLAAEQNDSQPLSGPLKWAGVSLLLAAAGVLFFSHLQAPLLEPEEALYAEVPREMAAAGSWLVPVHRGHPYYEKPPLFSWLIMAGYAIFGVNEGAARLVPSLAALATVLATFWWGKRLFGFRAGSLGALILCLSPRFVHQARMITMDGLLTFWVVSALALGQQALQGERLRWKLWLLSAAACGFGLLTKGPTALVLTALPLLAYQILNRNATGQVVRSWAGYVAVSAGVALPWYALLTWKDPAFLHEFFWTHHVLLRFVQPMHEEPVWFYVPALLLGMLPWTLLLPGLLKDFLPRRPRLAVEMKFLLVSVLWCVVFFSTADCKRIGYILPAMPLLALAFGHVLEQRLMSGGLWSRCAWAGGGLATLIVLTGAVHLLLPDYYRRFSMRDLITSLIANNEGRALPVACYPHHWDSIGYYLQRADVCVYSRDRRDRLLADLQGRPATLLFVKTGPALKEILQSLPPEQEFVSQGEARTVTAGVVRRRTATSAARRYTNPTR